MRGKSFGTVASPVVALGRSSGGGGRLLVATKSFGDTSFVAPAGGSYVFYVWGAGGAGNYGSDTPYGGGSAGAARKKVTLQAGQSVTLSMGRAGVFGVGYSSTATVTTVTFPDASTIQCTGGGSANNISPGAAGTATGGDVNVSGNAATTGNGANAAIIDGLGGTLGGPATTTGQQAATAPSGGPFGAGGGSYNTFSGSPLAAQSGQGGSSVLLVFQEV